MTFAPGDTSFVHLAITEISTMNITEVDWRYSSIAEILTAVGTALENIKSTAMDGDMDGDEANEQTEGFLGIAFVAAQTYITGAIADARKLANSTDPTKRKALKDYSDLISGKGITKAELCNAVANYFKHHEEWPNWNPDPANRREKGTYETIETLKAVGITETTSYPCQEAAKVLWGFTSSDLEQLLSILKHWRRNLIPKTP